MAMLADNLKQVQENIKQACSNVHRDPKEVTLVAVSKTKPLEMVEEILDQGVLEYGENKVQELVDKYERIKSPVHWHLIGHLQTNKVKYIIDKAVLIHSVDSLHLAKKISDEATKHAIIMPILVQVNVANEDTKFGITMDETKEFVCEIAKYPNIVVEGLMTSAPYVEDPEQNRQVFHNLYGMFSELQKLRCDSITMNTLSMGMTNDYMVAIEEGSTMVRVGTGIFGDRHYNE